MLLHRCDDGFCIAYKRNLLACIPKTHASCWKAEAIHNTLPLSFEVEFGNWLIGKREKKELWSQRSYTHTHITQESRGCFWCPYSLEEVLKSFFVCVKLIIKRFVRLIRKLCFKTLALVFVLCTLPTYSISCEHQPLSYLWANSECGGSWAHRQIMFSTDTAHIHIYYGVRHINENQHF